MANGACECEWKLEDDEEGVWYSACGDAWIFEEGTPADNMMKYCPFCGCLLTMRAPDPPEAEEVDDESIEPAGW